jgi:SAM-dependent methyltransferase
MRWRDDQMEQPCVTDTPPLDWTIAYYREQYADSVRPMLTEERSRAEVDFLLRATGLQPPAMVADVPCGFGRHTRIFAERGFHVVGIDQNADFIASAREQLPSDVTCELHVGDMRQAFGGLYDLVAILYHSFGFFSDDENRALLVDWAARLAPCGHLALDIWNREHILRNFAPERIWRAAPDLEVTESSTFDPLTSRLAIHYLYAYSDGRSYTYDASHRLYTLTEVCALFTAAGLELRSTWGALANESYTLDAPRLVAIGQRHRRA